MKEFVTAYGPKNRVKTENKLPSMTKQSFRDEANVNFIVAQYQKTGVLAHRELHEGNYGEFAAMDYHEAMNAVVAAQEMFASLPSNIRNRFDNDPGAFVDFTQDEANTEEMRELGLLPPERPPVIIEPAPFEPPASPEAPPE